MKANPIKYITLSVGIIAIAVSIAATEKKTSGGHPGSTGAPGELTCAQAGCHSDASVNDGATVNTITFGNNETQYEPGKTYTMKVKVQRSGIEKFGFQIVALQDKVNTNTGVFSVTNASQTHIQTNSGRKYVTHTSAGTVATTQGEKEWTFSWKAPLTDIGRVNFFLATNCTNGDNTNQNDEIFLTKFTIHSPTTVGIDELEPSKPEVTVYPNPSSEFITVSHLQEVTGFTTIALFNMEGKQVKSLYKGMHEAGESTYNCSISDLQPGFYILRIISQGKSNDQKIQVL